MTIRVICSFCNSKIDAPDHLRGQTRKCPKCKNSILIEEAAETKRAITVPKSVPVPSSVEVDNTGGVNLNSKIIWRYKPHNMYLIVSYDRIIAYWKFGEGWMLNIGTGFVLARRNINEIPIHGSFTFIEGIANDTEKGLRLAGIRFFELSGRSVLVPLGRSENEILDKITRRCSLNSQTKRFVLKFIRQNYPMAYTEDAQEVIDFLTNEDVHSQEIGVVGEDEKSPLEM